ncbi:MAG: hypothetical protein KatS3mg115_0654 [Candidatus Poribacteria bacterium]|nr:MAG: hypothetical protein KatS3mg115_0654 [Candidatus Poribacteria bacterium]
MRGGILWSWLVGMGALMCACAGVPSPPREPPSRPVSAEEINLARLTGTRLIVPSAVADFPPIALVDGVRRVERWERGAGWELVFDGPMLRNRYFDPTTDADAAGEPIEWLGLRRNYRQGKEFAALGWVLFAFERPRVVHGVTLYSVDTPEMPASRFGVRDVLVQYWDEPTQRWMNVVPVEGTRSRDNTATENVRAVLDVRFHPVRTDLLRIAIRWTNDTRPEQSFTVMGRREEYVRGTIRLVEVEVYGQREEGDAIASVAAQHLPGQAAPLPTAEEPASATPQPEQVLEVVARYALAYAERDLSALLDTLDEAFQIDEMDRQAFLDQLVRTFNEFPDFQYRLYDVAIQELSETAASVTGRFEVRLSPYVRQVGRGELRFELVRRGKEWKIRRIQVEPASSR